MGMIDSFRTSEKFSCPVCGTILSDWQSHESEGLLLIWVQGEKYPLDTELPDECVGDRREFLQSYTLPDEFMIYSYDCDCPYPIELLCHCEDGLWKRSQLFTGSTADKVFAGAETKSAYKKRMKWLRKEL